MAIGIGKLLGFRFLRNFNHPYFSRDIAEFWRHWHISLTTWFRDYLYIPLGGSRGGKWTIVRNTFIIFLVSGFWHGANWTFIAWGAFHAILFLPLILTGKNRKYTNVVAEGKILPNIKEIFQMGLTFALVVIGWVFFRADTIHDAIGYLEGIFQLGRLKVGYAELPTMIMIIILLIMEWIGRSHNYALEKLGLSWPSFARYLLYMIIAVLIILYTNGDVHEFIYFQF